MELIDDFKRQYPRYWSVWLGFISAVLSFLEVMNALGVAVPAFEGLLPPGSYAALSAASALAGLIARAIKQSGLNEEKADVDQP